MLRNRGGETALRLNGPSCFFGLLLVEIEVPGSRSLKDRRQVVRSILEKLRRGENVSASDLGPSESWTRICLGVACVANDVGHVRSTLDQVEGLLDREAANLDFEMLASRRKVGSYDEFSNRED
ncbi:MAG: DUF503 domain-containing protein [Synergistales bacterium]|jgi:uncharacterized protein YlxP (DUF503 family)